MNPVSTASGLNIDGLDCLRDFGNLPLEFITTSIHDRDSAMGEKDRGRREEKGFGLV